jgi:hypothetical protein
MAKATYSYGDLRPIEKCVLDIPGFGPIVVNNIPEVSDSKSANYNSEGVIGRSSPLHTYFFSDTRNISIQFHFYVLKQGDVERNLSQKRAIESCLYPREGDGETPFKPPVICTFKFGDFLAKEPLCVVLQSCSCKVDPSSVLDEETLCPYKFDMDTTWWVVYDPKKLPYNNRIITSGR